MYLRRFVSFCKIFDNSDPAITSSTIRPFMYKNITAGTIKSENNFVLNLGSNKIKDSVGVYVGKNVSNMMDLGYLDLNLGNNLLG